MAGIDFEIGRQLGRCRNECLDGNIPEVVRAKGSSLSYQGDFDGDGIRDLISASGNKLFFQKGYKKEGITLFEENPIVLYSSSNNAAFLGIVDVDDDNSDGKEDILIVESARIHYGGYVENWAWHHSYYYLNRK